MSSHGINGEPMAIQEEESPRFQLLARMVKSIYPEYVIERKPYAMNCLRIHVEHALKVVLIIGRS